MSSLVRSRIFSDWVTNYQRENLGGDINAGITVGVMLIPQGLAYALVAGMPPIYGLYATLIPLIVYALLGTSGQLAVGPVAMVSLLVATGVAPFAEAGSEAYIQLALLLALLVGAIQLGLGLLRFGFVTNFLSHPVLSGFTSAVSLIIAASQLKHLTGISIPSEGNILDTLVYIGGHLGNIHGPTIAIGLGGMAIIVAIKRFYPKIPGGVVALLLAILITWQAGLHEMGVAIVGSVPAGLPSFTTDFLSFSNAKMLFPTALAIALVGYLESIAVAKAFASKHNYSIDPSRELVALGLANVFGSFFRSFPTTGGLARTAVNNDAGAKTGLASLLSVGVVGLALLFFTPLFTYLPKALLASVIVIAVSGLIDIKEIKYLWKVNKTDLGLLMATGLAALFLGIEEGILVGVILSLLAFIQQASKPQMARLGQLAGTETFRNVDRFPDAVTTPGVVIFRIDASLFFGNIDTVRDAIEAVTPNTDGPNNPEVLVLDLYPVNRVDSSALHVLTKLHETLRSRKVKLFFSGVKGPVRDAMKASGLDAEVGTDHFYNSVFDASESAKRHLNSYLGS